MKRPKRPWWHRVLLYGGFFFGFYLALCVYLAGWYLCPGRTQPMRPRELQEVQIPTGKLNTPAWSTRNLANDHPSKTVFVFAHGYGGDRGHWTRVVRDLEKKGYDSVIPALPGQDQSPYSRVGFGREEAKVLQQTFDWVRRGNPKPKIIVVGVSMGGAAAWLSSELDPTIDGVVTEGAYARFAPAMSHWLDQALPYGSITLRPVVWIASARSGIDPASINPEDAARKWKGRPALVMQAGDDRLIEKWHAVRLAEAAGCELTEVPGAVHAGCCDQLGERYADLLAHFAERLP
ncbi:MAG: alpha/beta hydrolase [Fimbriimonas sp.]